MLGEVLFTLRPHGEANGTNKRAVRYILIAPDGRLTNTASLHRKSWRTTPSYTPG